MIRLSLRYVPPQRVWLLDLFGLKTAIDFAHFGLESNRVLFSREDGSV